MKVKCTGYKRDERRFTIGKVYEWSDNKLVDDLGVTIKSIVKGKDPQKWELSRWYSFEVVKECENKIIITSDGTTTTAKMYDGKKFIKSATAKCSTEDEFNFEIGANIAYGVMNTLCLKVINPKKNKKHLPRF